MAKLPPKTLVDLDPKTAREFRFPPMGAGGQLVVAVQAGALKSASSLTTVVRINNDVVGWVASLDEASLTQTGTSDVDARDRLASLLLVGDATWSVIQPGNLRMNVGSRKDTVYQGTRPWLVVGGPHHCGLLAMPLNDRGTGALRFYECEVRGADLDTPNSKDSKLELAHIWSLPRGLKPIGSLKDEGRDTVRKAIAGFYP